MHKHSVAVIIPCFNSSKFIKKTLDSVLNQDYNNLEIVAIDDGSTDETRKILESYLPKIRILSHPNNANFGQAASLNFGISQAKSNLIAFLDSDDIWYTGKVKEQVRIFEKYSDIGLVYTNGDVVDEKDTILFKMLPEDFQEDNSHGRILLQCYIKTPSSVMVRREIFEETGLFNTNLYSTDHDMWVRINEVTKFYYLPDFFTAYRKRTGQISSKRQLWEDGFVILKEASKRYPYGVNLRRKRMAVLYYRLGEYDWVHKLYLKATKHFWLVGMFDPLRGAEVFISSIFHVSNQN
jgi:glycosyltransferase involved in cell wall biosynthesis